MPDRVSLTPARQAAYHLGCAARHLWKAFVAFFPVACLLSLLLILALLLLALTGCTAAAKSQNVKLWNPLTWFSGSEARTQARAATRADQGREAVLKAAQRSAHESTLALEAAPASRPVEIATESAQTTTGLLDQALGPVPLDELATLRARVTALLSENQAVRAEAEKDRARARADAAQLSRDLAAAAAARAKAETDLASAFARENALANELRNQRLIKWALVGVSLIAAAGWIYLRFVAGGLPGAIGKALAWADREDPEKAAAARAILDPHLNRNEQSSIAGEVARIALKIKTT